MSADKPVWPQKDPALAQDLSESHVSIKIACERLGISRRTIYNYLTQGKLSYRRTPGGNVRIVEKTLWA